MTRLRRFAPLLVIFAVSLISSCEKPRPPQNDTAVNRLTETETSATAPPWVVEACTSGNKSKNKPIICVDDGTLAANPSPAPVWDVEKKRGTTDQPSNRPVTIRWIAKDTVNLQVKFKDESCVKSADVKCDGYGECTAKIKPIDWNTIADPDGDGKKYLPCKYDLSATNIDPEGDLIVNPCCW